MYNNLIYITAAKYSATSEDVPAIDARIFTWDSFSPSWIDEIAIQAMIGLATRLASADVPEKAYDLAEAMLSESEKRRSV